MIKLSSISQNHLVLNCWCGHTGKISVSHLLEIYGGDLIVDAIERAARCSRCGGKTVKSLQIIYIGGSYEAIENAYTSNKC